MANSPLDGFVLYEKPVVTKAGITMRVCPGGISFTKKTLERLGMPKYVNIFFRRGGMAVCASEEGRENAFELGKGEGCYRGPRMVYYKKILDDIAAASGIPRDELVGYRFPGTHYKSTSEYVIFDLTKGVKGK